MDSDPFSSGDSAERYNLHILVPNNQAGIWEECWCIEETWCHFIPSKCYYLNILIEYNLTGCQSNNGKKDMCIHFPVLFSYIRSKFNTLLAFFPYFILWSNRNKQKQTITNTIGYYLASQATFKNVCYGHTQVWPWVQFYCRVQMMKGCTVLLFPSWRT